MSDEKREATMEQAKVEAVGDSDLSKEIREPLYTAWNKYRDWCEGAGDTADITDFRTGFVRGFAAATRWHRIEGLPNESGEDSDWYLARFSDGVPTTRALYQLRADAEYYTHYQRIEFTPEEETNDDN